jgi:hypothetical protein
MEPMNRFRESIPRIASAKLGIDSWDPLKVYKYGLSTCLWLEIYKGRRWAGPDRRPAPSSAGGDRPGIGHVVFVLIIERGGRVLTVS